MKKIKKLISIKTDDSGEQIYFTHEKGVETIKKDEIIEIELLNTKNILKKFFSNPNDTASIYGARLIFTFGPAIGMMIEGHIKSYLLLVIGCIFIPLSAFNMYRIRNDRNILKVYSENNVFYFKLTEENQYKELYSQFNYLLKKYCPKEGELILYDDNPKKKNTRYLLIIFEILLIISCVGDLIKNGTSVYLIIVLFIAFLVLIYDYVLLKYSKYQYARYFYQNNFLKEYIKYNYKQGEIILETRISSIQLFKNNDSVAILPRDSNPLQEIEKWEDLEGGIHHKLMFSEEYRDLTPILIEYFNDISNEFFEKEKLTSVIQKIGDDEVRKKVEIEYNKAIDNITEKISANFDSNKHSDSINKLKITNKLDSLDLLISSLIGHLPKWENENHTNFILWKFTVEDRDGYVQFIEESEDIYEIYFHNSKIYPL